ncbi:nucleotidyltransferase family protein [Ramlibacter sp. WS9]|uniref:nucleotidyltransferase family protein n=1 Tax=Ramlibacter sp. WS9 TaxID=1882741 RepID=UPI001142E6A6|nr:nucleotidyltransferase family protein [Ramlibacter sp. WS9]ROZ62931.1 hypothetical protein EEB15_30475 [Ramlibacter sp. WS9]
MTTTNRFIEDILTNPHNRAIFARWDALALPDGWLVAGCLFQTVWNLRSGAAPEAQIKDYDLFYFDAQDLTEEAEQHVQARVEAALGDLGVVVVVEAKNQGTCSRPRPGRTKRVGRPALSLRTRSCICASPVGIVAAGHSALRMSPVAASRSLLLYFAAQSAPPPRSGKVVGIRPSRANSVSHGCRVADAAKSRRREAVGRRGTFAASATRRPWLRTQRCATLR